MDSREQLDEKARKGAVLCSLQEQLVDAIMELKSSRAPSVQGIKAKLLE